METNQQTETQRDPLEDLIAEIVSDPEVRDAMLRLQQIDVEKN